jgi:hypothetical protein
MSQGNSLCSYLKQKKKVIFFYYKMGEQEQNRFCQAGWAGEEKRWYQWEGGGYKERVYM